MLHWERLSGEAACSVLKNYDTEDMEEFAQEILGEVVRERRKKEKNQPQMDADKRRYIYTERKRKKD